MTKPELLIGTTPEVIAENIKTLMRTGLSEKQALSALSARVPDDESDTQETEPDADHDDSGKQLGN